MLILAHIRPNGFPSCISSLLNPFLLELPRVCVLDLDPLLLGFKSLGFDTPAICNQSPNDTHLPVYLSLLALGLYVRVGDDDDDKGKIIRLIRMD